MTGSRPRYVDEHSVSLPVPPQEAYVAARSYAEGLVRPPTGRALGLLTRVLGTDPPSGFAIAEEQPPRLVSLAGRHRFSRHVMDLRVDPAPGGSTVTVVTWADFPGPGGAVYRTLVVGSRGHVLAVRRMLAAIASRATRPEGRPPRG